MCQFPAKTPGAFTVTIERVDRPLRLYKKLFMALVIGFGAVSCSKAPDLVGVDNPEMPALSVAAVARQSIFIMTTREASEAEGVFYGPDRAPELGFA